MASAPGILVMDESRRLLAYRPLILSLAGKFNRPDQFDDLVQEGYRVALEALRSVDARGDEAARVSFMVGRRMQRYLDKSPAFRLSLAQAEEARRAWRKGEDGPQQPRAVEPDGRDLWYTVDMEEAMDLLEGREDGQEDE